MTIDGLKHLGKKYITVHEQLNTQQNRPLLTAADTILEGKKNTKVLRIL